MRSSYVTTAEISPGERLRGRQMVLPVLGVTSWTTPSVVPPEAGQQLMSRLRPARPTLSAHSPARDHEQITVRILGGAAW